jgi:branched-chain amino acid transport system ATP-binding protein
VRREDAPVKGTPMLVVERVTAGYGALEVLHEVSLTIAEGEIVSLVGANGAGKTTLIRTIVGLVRARAGRVDFRGDRIDGRTPEAIVTRGVSVVPEGARVFPDMTVLDNLRMGAAASEARAREAETMAEVFTLFPRLSERRPQLARTLSGGERQMLAIGRALMARPRLLLLDEPSLGIQPSLVKGIIDTVRAINERGLTVFLIEQNVHLALPISHRAYVLEQGRIVLEDEGRALLANPHVRVAYLGV